MKNLTFKSLIATVFFSGLLCCSPIDKKAETPNSCAVRTQQKTTEQNFSDKTFGVIGGTEWMAKIDGWEVQLFESERELVGSIENYKSVDLAVGSIVVLPWIGCPNTFIRNAADDFIKANSAQPLKDALVELNGHPWYLFSFKMGGNIIGIFAATTNSNHGFIVECSALGDFDDQIEVCSEFVSSFVILEPGTNRKKDVEAIDL